MLSQLGTRPFGGPLDQGVYPRLSAQRVECMDLSVSRPSWLLVNHWPAYGLLLPGEQLMCVRKIAHNSSGVEAAELKLPQPNKSHDAHVSKLSP